MQKYPEPTQNSKETWHFISIPGIMYTIDPALPSTFFKNRQLQILPILFNAKVLDVQTSSQPRSRRKISHMCPGSTTTHLRIPIKPHPFHSGSESVNLFMKTTCKNALSQRVKLLKISSLYHRCPHISLQEFTSKQLTNLPPSKIQSNN